MPSPLGVWDELSLKITAGQTSSPWTSVGNPSAVGLAVPALGTATTVTVQVARAAAGTGGGGLVNGAGTAVLALASGSGGVNVSGVDLAALLGYPFMRVVLGAAQGAAQGADVTFWLERKMTGHEPTC
jgi:hypothetical protein